MVMLAQDDTNRQPPRPADLATALTLYRDLAAERWDEGLARTLTAALEALETLREQAGELIEDLDRAGCQPCQGCGHWRPADRIDHAGRCRDCAYRETGRRWDARRAAAGGAR